MIVKKFKSILRIVLTVVLMIVLLPAISVTPYNVTVKSDVGSRYILTVEMGMGSGVYQAGEQVVISANLPPANVRFDRWIGGNGGTFSDVNNSVTIFTMPANNATVRFTYRSLTVPIAVESVKLNKVSLTLLKKKTTTLTEAVFPHDAANKAVTWKSSNKKVATVTTEGVVTAKKPGTAKITVTTEEGDKRATCRVTVAARAKKIKLNRPKLSLARGKSSTLKATTNPIGAKYGLTWISNNKKVARVSAKGIVKGVKKGKATIKVKTANGKTAKCVVTVKKK